MLGYFNIFKSDRGVWEENEEIVVFLKLREGSVLGREKWLIVLVVVVNKKEFNFIFWRLWCILEIVVVVEITFLLECVKERMLWIFYYGELIDIVKNIYIFINR